MTRVRDLHEKWSKDPDYRKAYDEMGSEFGQVRADMDAFDRILGRSGGQPPGAGDELPEGSEGL